MTTPTIASGTGAWTPGPWTADAMPCGGGLARFIRSNGRGIVARVHGDQHPRAVNEANARLIASAPDHALICWAMCVQDGRWEEWVPYDGKGEFVFAGLRYATSIDEFGAPKLTPALREAIAKAEGRNP